jgi:putative methionine-R-sulfoxide reductase with GAF domain
VPFGGSVSSWFMLQKMCNLNGGICGSAAQLVEAQHYEDVQKLACHVSLNFL